MYSRINDDRSIPDALAERLRRLPGFEPPAGGWQRLERRLSAPRRFAMAAGGGLALAASVLMAVALRPQSGVQPGDGAVAPATVAALAPASRTAQLIKVSQELERNLTRLRPQVAVWDSSHAERANQIRQQVAVVDLQLNYADPATAQDLWRERVELMSNLVELHQSPSPALQYASYQY